MFAIAGLFGVFDFGLVFNCCGLSFGFLVGFDLVCGV